MPLKTGPLTIDDMRAIWAGALDKAYRNPILAAGDGHGLEAHGQAWAQYARLSEAVDVTTQEMFILPWSGQTNPSAAGARNATVALTFSRARRLEAPMVLAAGQVFFEEVTTDWGTNGGVVVATGRRYTLAEDLVFFPGEAGPKDAIAVAELPGHGYNNPRPGTISLVDQPGGRLGNEVDLASVVVRGPVGLVEGMSASATIATPNFPDMFVPENVGQYVLFTQGANAGKLGRISSFLPPDLSVLPRAGSKVSLDVDQAVDSDSFSGTFVRGEIASLDNGSGPFATARVVAERIVDGVKQLVFLVVAGDYSMVVEGTTFTGLGSGATLALRAYLQDRLFDAETDAAGWRVFGWDAGWGLVVSNADFPAGGRLGMLDELGRERDLGRAPGEPDAIYRQRVSTIADVVVPNAIKRALSRTLGGIPWCFREVGTEKLRGFFYDGDLGPPGGDSNTVSRVADLEDAYDTDVLLLGGGPTTGTFYFQERAVLEDFSGDVLLVRAEGYVGRIDGGDTSLTFIRRAGDVPDPLVPGDLRVRGLDSGATWVVDSHTDTSATALARKFRVVLDYLQFRGFFEVGVPRLSSGEFGFAYDVGAHDAYDAAPYDAFYDGAPIGAAAIYARVYHAVDVARAGGVEWGLYLIGDETCPSP